MHVAVLQAFVGLPGAGAGAIFCGHTQPLQALPAMSEVRVSSFESRFSTLGSKNLSRTNMKPSYKCNEFYIQTSRMRCVLRVFEGTREAEFIPRSTQRCINLFQAVLQKLSDDRGT